MGQSGFFPQCHCPPALVVDAGDGGLRCSSLSRCTASSPTVPEIPRLSSTSFGEAKMEDGSIPTMQVFVEQLMSGVRVVLSLDGIGLDVDAKLDQSCEILTLVFNGVDKAIPLVNVRNVSVRKSSAIRQLAQLEEIPPDSEPSWRVCLELEDDRFCEFSFSAANDAQYFGGCLQVLVEAVRFKAAKRSLDSAEEADLAAGAMTGRSVAPNLHPGAELAQDPEAFMAALTRALEDDVDSPQSESLNAELPSDISP
mmetsp:Transcript_19045/g.35721  ORF Transcript_19045/g.35721 Transcript_19045/m.35721 type:complete len:254 (+) Transcript_19045:30-791(+)